MSSARRSAPDSSSKHAGSRRTGTGYGSATSTAFARDAPRIARSSKLSWSRSTAISPQPGDNSRSTSSFAAGPGSRNLSPAGVTALLTDEAPDDPDLRLRRRAIVHQLISSVIVHDTDDGLSVELIGPLVPPDSDPGAWTPEQAVDGLTEPRLRPLPAVPQPFRYRPKPERLVPAYRWYHELPAESASETFTRNRFIAAIRFAAARHPTGPLFRARGVGAQRWRAVADERGLPTEPNHVFKATRALGTTPSALIREAIGAREAVTHGRLQVHSRADAVWVLVEAIHDGFAFDDGWSKRVSAFGVTRPYPLTHESVSHWSHPYGNGAISDLVRAALVLAAAESKRLAGTPRADIG